MRLSANGGKDSWDLPADWRQYQDVKMGGMAIKVGLVFKQGLQIILIVKEERKND
ncbi:MAG: hypothetical protein ABIF11_06215 [Nitrospirota bacterium]